MTTIVLSYWNVSQFKKLESIVFMSMRYRMEMSWNTPVNKWTILWFLKVSVCVCVCALQISILHNSFAGPSLIDANVVSVAGGICGSCQFTDDSTAKGCTIKLYMNDDHTFYFNISRQKHRDTLLLKCFEVSTPGLFHVEVHEASDVESKDNIMLKLPDVVISHKLVEILSNGMSVMDKCNICYLFCIHRNCCDSSRQHLSSDWSFSCVGDHYIWCHFGCLCTVHIPCERKTP